MNYEDIRRVNAEIKTKPIKGKEYAEVPERVQAFRKLYPNGDIRTSVVPELTSLVDGLVTLRVDVYDEDGKHLADGLAYEKEGSSFINKTSYIENCQTSAVGRALGFDGIGSDSSIASAEEVENAINNQQRPDPQPPKQYRQASKPADADPFQEWKDKITPLWRELKGDDHDSAVDLGRRYRAMNSDEEYQVLYKSLIKEKKTKGESNA